MNRFTTLFLDIGGVLLTNAWDRTIRHQAAGRFGLDFEEFDRKHREVVDPFERGLMTLDEYLEQTVFYEPRSFSQEQFREFMYGKSCALPNMMEWVQAMKGANGLHVVAVSNESRELTNFRIERFNLREIFDVFVCSCFVQCRKPSRAVYRMALEITQASPWQVIYVDDREEFARVGASLGIRSMHHRSFEATRQQFKEIGVDV